MVQACKEIGVARSLFYEIRDGKRAPTHKAWAKLIEAERKAGLARSEGSGDGQDRRPVSYRDTPPETGLKLAESGPVFASEKPSPEELERRIDEVIAELEQIKRDLLDQKN